MLKDKMKMSLKKKKSKSEKKDEEESDEFNDDLILHQYKHPVEQFMIEEDFQYFYEQFDEQIVQILDEIIDLQEDDREANNQ